MGNITHRAGDDYTTTYNRLSLPQSVTKTSGQSYTYGYLADGTKTSEIGSDGYGYRYLGTMRFRITPTGEVFDSTPFGHGRIVRNQSTGALSTQYHITDHLGSTRFVTNSSGSQTAAYNYTPFGVMQEVGTGSNSTDYTFSGKEKQLYGNVLDFGARLYDPRTAIWNAMDPKAEKYFSISPYAYCNNNPVIFVDPDGEWVQVIAGAAIGAAVNGIIAYSQGKTGEELLGAVEGAITSLIPSSMISKLKPLARAGARLAVGALSGAAGSATNQIISDGDIDGNTLITDTVFSAIFSFSSGAIGDYAANKFKANVSTDNGKDAVRDEFKKANRNAGKANTSRNLNNQVGEYVQSVNETSDVVRDFTDKTTNKVLTYYNEQRKQ